MNHTPDNSPLEPNKILSYALFHCDPQQEPPFDLDLGFSNAAVLRIRECQHIPDAIEKLEAYCSREAVSKTTPFTLLYPIYLDAMGTDGEDTMHNIAWLIKEQADRQGWSFGRIGGYSEKTVADYS